MEDKVILSSKVKCFLFIRKTSGQMRPDMTKKMIPQDINQRVAYEEKAIFAEKMGSGRHP